LDELADLVKMDPLEFRIRNLPPTAPDAMWAEYFRMGAARFGWDKRHPTGDRAAGPIKTGMGCAANQWGGGGRLAHVRLAVLADGSVTVNTGSQDIGTGTRGVAAIVAAETLGAPVAAVRADIGDTQYGFAGASGGSTTAAAVGASVRIAAGKARDALFARVAGVLKAPADSLVAIRSRIHVKDDPSRGLSWTQACKHLGMEPIHVESQWEPGLSSVNSSGVQFAEVAVDVDTGIVKVTRVLAIQDCGRVVNKLTAESQVYGGVVGSLNFALFEDRLLDRNTGQMVNPNMEHYLLAGMSDIPEIDVVLIDQPTRGIVGVGEPPTVSTAAAIANAVRNAIGVTIRGLPLHPHRVLAALGATK
jgi:xanthine dehydrogenase YagR molybdenum-binding subunit